MKKKISITTSLKNVKKVIPNHSIIDTLDSLCDNDIILSYIINDDKDELRVCVNDHRRIDVALLFESLTNSAPIRTTIGNKYTENK